MYKVLVTGRNFGVISEHDFDYFTDKGYELVMNPFKGRMPNEQELCDIIGGIDAILIGNDTISDRVLEHSDKLKVIAKSGIGTDNIDLIAASKRGISVTNVPGTTANSVAELTLGLMLCISKLIVFTNRRVMNGMWPVDRGNDLYGKTLGIIGFGRIGQAVAKRANGFDMKVLAFDEIPNRDAAATLGVEFTTMNSLIKQSDYITLHVPKTPQTENMFNSESIGLMKKGAFLINASRGGIVNEDALFEALKSGHLAGAAADVLAVEPPTSRPQLFDCDNFLITSHSGGNSKESILLTSKIAAQNIIQVLEGKSCPNIVNERMLQS